MTNDGPIRDPIRAIALLEEAHRRDLYEFVSVGGRSVSRDEAAAALGLSRELAAFHLDRLVAGGLLETEYRRLSGRTGPGAGRPAKLYRRTDREFAVSLPRRRYEQAAELLADALSRLHGTSGADMATEVARARGTEIGREARRRAGPRPSRRRLVAVLLGLLRGVGYEPEMDPASGDICLRNCPYAALAKSHRELTCGTNLAWAEGVVTGLGHPGLGLELAPEPGRCCVVVHASPLSPRPLGS